MPMQMKLQLQGLTEEQKASVTRYVEIADRRTLGAAIRTARRKLLKTQQEIADTVGMDNQLLSSLECANRRCVTEANWKLIEDVCVLLELPAPKRGKTLTSPVEAAEKASTPEVKKQPRPAPAQVVSAYLTRSDVAKRLDVSLVTVRRMEGVQLHPKKIDGVHFFDPDEVEALSVRKQAEKVQSMPADTSDQLQAAIALYRSNLLTMGEFLNITARLRK